MAVGPLVLAYGRTNQRIICPHKGATVPSSDVNITILDSDGNEILASTAATKGSFASTVATAANAGDTSVTAAAVTNLAAGEPIGLTEDGETEIATVRRVDSSSKLVTCEDRLARSYSIGAVMKSAHVYHDADLSETDDYPAGLYYQARFTCADWGQDARSLIFRIVKRATGNPIEFEHMRMFVPHIATLRDSSEKSGLDTHRETAWQFISAMLLSEGIDPQTIRDPELYAQAGGALACAYFMIGRPGGVEMAKELAGSPPGNGGIFLEWYRKARAIPHWVDRDQDGLRQSHEMRSGRKLGRGL